MRLCVILLSCALAWAQTPAPVEATLNAAASGRPFPHFWEQMFGSGRAVLSLRESYRQDLKSVRDITGFRYIRFHAIFQDEIGVYPDYNFSYVDQIYDGLLENGVKPFVELSFMPRALAASDVPHAFWYKPLANPPKSYDRWGELIYNFTKHLVDRYGLDEVSTWYFEVWNEPNIDFWTGSPKQATYFQLYDAASTAVKRVNARLRVGGPSTAQAAWVDAFIAHCVTQRVPFDFVSTHVYANDSSEDVLGTHETIPRSDMVARAVRKVYDQVRASARPDTPIFWTEYNASYKNEVEVTDSAFMGPWLANNIRLCDGLQTIMAYWSFSDVFEEQGVVKTPFYGGYGLIAERGIPKAAYNAFALLHLLGNERLPLDVPWALATKRPDGSIVVAAWNYAAPESNGRAVDVKFKIDGAASLGKIRTHIVDRNHGSALKEWETMGRPGSPTREQIRLLREAARMAVPEERAFHPGEAITLHLEPHALSVIEVVR